MEAFVKSVVRRHTRGLRRSWSTSINDRLLLPVLPNESNLVRAPQYDTASSSAVHDLQPLLLAVSADSPAAAVVSKSPAPVVQQQPKE